MRIPRALAFRSPRFTVVGQGGAALLTFVLSPPQAYAAKNVSRPLAWHDDDGFWKVFVKKFDISWRFGPKFGGPVEANFEGESVVQCGVGSCICHNYNITSCKCLPAHLVSVSKTCGSCQAED